MNDGEEEFKLTEHIKVNILNIWQSGCKDLNEITGRIFPGLDGRFKEGRAIKKFLIQNKLNPKLSHKYTKKIDEFELTEDQKEFIRNNASNNKAEDLAKEIFEQTLNPNDTRLRAVKKFCELLDPNLRYKPEDNEVTNKYYPPKNHTQAMRKIEKWVQTKNFAKNPPRQFDLQCFDKLISYMHNFHFLHIINQYYEQDKRDLFESTFVRYIHDKPDLIEEELDQYIDLCSDIVHAETIRHDRLIYQKIRDEYLNQEDVEKKKLSYTMVEYLGKLETELNNTKKRIEKNYERLVSNRAERLANQHSANASVHALVLAMQDAEKRAAWVAIAKKRKEQLRNEQRRLSDLDNLKAEIFGLSESEAVDMNI
ncbi:MAG: hypothetical protein HC836_12660 [Richelia sp. RM2_1_2]|nr:hypothetical protein [Richelia sp. RM2_1_2]